MLKPELMVNVEAGPIQSALLPLSLLLLLLLVVVLSVWQFSALVVAAAVASNFANYRLSVCRTDSVAIY